MSENLKFEAVLLGIESRGYRYDPEILEKVTKITEERPLIGELGTPQTGDPMRQVSVLYKEASHILDNFQYDRETHTLRADITILETPCGKMLKELINGGGINSVEFSLRGVGTNIENPDKVITWDANPKGLVG